jgi:hypothetical protein
MTPVPKTKAEEIMQQLEPFMDQVVKLDAFTLQRLKREAIQNRATDPWASSVAVGMIGVLEWDEHAVEKSFQNALSMRSDEQTRTHYATSLQLIGKYVEAASQARLASEMAPTNLSLLSRAISYSLTAGLLTMAAELVHQYNLRSPGRPYETGFVIDQANEILRSQEINETLVVECNRIAFEILRTKKVAFSSTQFEADSQDGYIMHYIILDEPLEVVEELDIELGIRLFDSVSEFNPDKYWVGFISKLDRL